jgi:hypothetical protein
MIHFNTGLTIDGDPQDPPPALAFQGHLNHLEAVLVDYWFKNPNDLIDDLFDIHIGDNFPHKIQKSGTCRS